MNEDSETQHQPLNSYVREAQKWLDDEQSRLVSREELRRVVAEVSARQQQSAAQKPRPAYDAWQSVWAWLQPNRLRIAWKLAAMMIVVCVVVWQTTLQQTVVQQRGAQVLPPKKVNKNVMTFQSASHSASESPSQKDVSVARRVDILSRSMPLTIIAKKAFERLETPNRHEIFALQERVLQEFAHQEIAQAMMQFPTMWTADDEFLAGYAHDPFCEHSDRHYDVLLSKQPIEPPLLYGMNPPPLFYGGF